MDDEPTIPVAPPRCRVVLPMPRGLLPVLLARSGAFGGRPRPEVFRGYARSLGALPLPPRHPLLATSGVRRVRCPGCDPPGVARGSLVVRAQTLVVEDWLVVGAWWGHCPGCQRIYWSDGGTAGFDE